MNIRRLVFALLLAPVLLFSAIAITSRVEPVLLLPEFDSAAVAQIELSHGRDILLLVRERQGNGWVIRSAADAPGDTARIEATLARIVATAGQPPADGAAPAAAGAAPMDVRLLDGAGNRLAELAFWSNRAKLLPDGPELAIARAPALPMWPSAWSSLRPPAIDIGKIARVQRLTPDGLRLLDDGDAARVGLVLGRLTAQGFRSGAEIDWRGSRMLRVRFVDGSSLDLAQVPDGEGRFFLRLASGDRRDVQAVERFAFRVAESLP